MKYFIVEASYLAPFEKLKTLIAQHRAYLQHGYDAGMILCSGPQSPPLGGFIIARAQTLAQLQSFLAGEPFAVAQLASYRVQEFEPVLYQPWAGAWFKGEDRQ